MHFSFVLSVRGGCVQDISSCVLHLDACIPFAEVVKRYPIWQCFIILLEMFVVGVQTQEDLTALKSGCPFHPYRILGLPSQRLPLPLRSQRMRTWPLTSMNSSHRKVLDSLLNRDEKSHNRMSCIKNKLLFW